MPGLVSNSLSALRSATGARCISLVGRPICALGGSAGSARSSNRAELDAYVVLADALGAMLSALWLQSRQRSLRRLHE